MNPSRIQGGLMLYNKEFDLWRKMIRGSEFRNVLHQNFKMKYLGELKYFLRINAAISSKGIVLSQRKYALELLEDVRLGEAKLESKPLEQNEKLTSIEYDQFVQLGADGDELFPDVAVYW
ncbi:hypothetical protein J1N35_034815 [Gossypium stocksii]|uniref:Reverse transcriptase Ty1/copia-type domain-containing protein n=1 Tax=Gossypium stocksii TaxID=47602 RepID=A0A9D3UT94_9ROSI|nr:hypothetical protein J1N35_034815 [Gossypium stocksii]